MTETPQPSSFKKLSTKLNATHNREKPVKVTFLDEDSDEKEQRTNKLIKFSDKLAKAIDDLRRDNIEKGTKKNTTGCHERHLERKRKEAVPHSSLNDTADLNRFWG